MKSGLEQKKGINHSEKAKAIVTRIENQISSGKLNDQEKRVTRVLIEDLKKALSGS